MTMLCFVQTVFIASDSAAVSGWLSSITSIVKKLDASSILKEWDTLQSELNQLGDHEKQESLLIQEERVHRARFFKTVENILDNLCLRFENIVDTSTDKDARFWKTIMSLYFKVQQGKATFRFTGLEGFTPEEQAVEHTLNRLMDRVNDMGQELQLQDEGFWLSANTLTGSVREQQDRAQMQVAEVMEDLSSMFELVGRKLLTADSLIHKRDEKQRIALDAVEKSRVNLQRQRLEKKREHSYHKEAADVARRENYELREELNRVQQELEQAQRDILLRQCEKRRGGRSTG